MKAMQWNIGGGKIRQQDSDPTLPDSYSENGLTAIVELLIQESPDVITLQETHANSGQIQAEEIAQRLGYEYWVNDVYADSHLEKDQKLGQAIISRFSLNDHTFKLFLNPNYTANWDEWYGGAEVKSHDKGLTSVKLQLPDDRVVSIQTLHLLPFRRFNVDPLSAEGQPVLDDIQQQILKAAGHLCLIQGDFNLDSESLENYLPRLFESELAEVLQQEVTTPKGKRFDHVLYRGIKIMDSQVIDDVLTDHFPVISEFS